jgi:hypothetical protein
VGPLIRKVPLEPEITFASRRCVRGDERNKQLAGVDLAADPLIPRFSAPQLALVEKDFHPSGAQRVADSSRRLRILRGVAQEYRL